MLEHGTVREGEYSNQPLLFSEHKRGLPTLYRFPFMSAITLCRGRFHVKTGKPIIVPTCTHFWWRALDGPDTFYAGVGKDIYNDML